ncbi:hypothetical protein GCM10022222_22230 [Amycolatopsis ultiminotia]|uniref:Uncharacterized protein n=1 Tax=Amycolatopsis ultiminotia TaxID=543629 RepID=A0ABP6VNQ0_9PSEU
MGTALGAESRALFNNHVDRMLLDSVLKSTLDHDGVWQKILDEVLGTAFTSSGSVLWLRRNTGHAYRSGAERTLRVCSARAASSSSGG